MKENSLFAALPKGSISEILVGRITDAIINGELKPGDKIPTEVEFSEQLKISRNSVREAIKVLESFGVLEIRRSEGTFVVEEFNQKMMDPMIYGLIMENKSMLQLLELKITMLRAVMYLAVEKATASGVERLRQCYLDFCKALEEHPRDIELNYRTSNEFYRVMGEITGNTMVFHLNAVVLKMSKYSRMKGLANAVAGMDQDAKMPFSPFHCRLLLEAIEKHDQALIEPALQATREEWEYLVFHYD